MIPNLAALEAPKIGKCGTMRHNYLRDHHRGIFDGMLLTDRLNAHLEEVDRQAKEMMELLAEQMAKAEGRERGSEGQGPNGLGGCNEQHQGPGRGDHPARSGLRMMARKIMGALQNERIAARPLVFLKVCPTWTDFSM